MKEGFFKYAGPWMNIPAWGPAWCWAMSASEKEEFDLLDNGWFRWVREDHIMWVCPINPVARVGR